MLFNRRRILFWNICCSLRRINCLCLDQSVRASWLLVSLWCAVLFAYGLNAGPLYRTESLRAMLAAECLRGHWLVPTLYGEPFLTKPPGHYVAIAILSWPFGEVTAITARLPSVLAATIAVILMATLFRRIVSPRAGLLIALLLPTTVLWLDKVPSAEIDMTLLGWVTATLVLGFNACQPGRVSFFRWLLSFLCLAGGTLTKWTAPAFFVLTFLPFLYWQGQLRLLIDRRVLLAATFALFLIVLWGFVVGESVGWAILRDTLKAEASYRFLPGSKKQEYPLADVGTYPLIVWASHLPLSLFALLTLRKGSFTGWSESRLVLLRFLHCWTWPNLIFWSLVPNHNVRYILPLSPGLMGLSVLGILAILERAQPIPLFGYQRTAKQILVGFLGFWLLAKLLFVEVVQAQRAERRNPIPIGAELRRLIPEGEIVYLGRLKDEGVLFYYGRPARRCRNFNEIPRPAYALLLESEWYEVQSRHAAELIRWMYDQQGDPLVVARLK